MPRSASLSAQPLLAGSQPSFWRDDFKGKIDEDDPIWKEYVKVAIASDMRMVDDWNKILDVILVFVALMISASTPFAIESMKQFEPDAAAMTNDILLALYNKPSNGSSVPALRISDFMKLQPSDLQKAVFSNGLLSASLALSIVISMVAVTARVWLVRYNYRANSHGSSEYNKAMQRQEAYSGVKAWRLGTIIEALPLLVLVAVFLFGLYIQVSFGTQYRLIGYAVGTTFFAGLVFLFVVSFTAAFIPSAPFHSCISDIVGYLFNTLLAEHRLGIWRTVVVVGVFFVTAISTIVLVLNKAPSLGVLTFFPVACAFALARKPARAHDYSPWCSLPRLIFLASIALFLIMAIASWFNKNRVVFSLLCGIGYFILGCAGLLLRRWTQFIPDTEEAEAIAWLLGSSPPNSSTFKKAAQIGNTPRRKVVLLNALLPLLPHFIDSRSRSQLGELEFQELQLYVSSLASLSQFPDSASTISSNMASVEHPPLPLILLAQLERLSKHRDARVRTAVEAVWCHYLAGEGGEKGDSMV